MQNPPIFSTPSMSMSMFLLLLLTLPIHLATSTRSSMDIINQTCRKCSQVLPKTFNYTFCSASLHAVPVSRFTNLQGLGIISMELALVNATSTISTIAKILSTGGLDPFAVGCLTDCLRLYSGASKTLVETIGAFMVAQYGVTEKWVSEVMDATETCEDGFKAKEGEARPLTRENYDLFQLSDIALCIIHLLSSSSSS